MAETATSGFCPLGGLPDGNVVAVSLCSVGVVRIHNTKGWVHARLRYKRYTSKNRCFSRGSAAAAARGTDT